MPRSVITASMVQEAATRGVLDVPPGALVTPLARDVARDLGVDLVPSGQSPSPAGPSAGMAGSGDLQERVRTIVTALLAGGGATEVGSTPPSGPRLVKLCRQADAQLEDFPHPGPPPGMQVRSQDVVTSADGAPMAAGYLTLTRGSFPWTLSYDEVQIVLEGELHIGTKHGTQVGRPGDILYVPKGSEITFGTPNWAKFIYVTFPADWEEGL